MVNLAKEQNQSITTARLATQFLDRPDLAATTLRSYENIISQFLQQYGALPVELVNREVCKRYLESLRHLSVSSHQQHQRVLYSLFQHAVEEELISQNPMTGLKRRKALETGEHETDEIKYLTQELLQQLFDAVKQYPRLRALVSLLYESGARISEILQLDRTSLDWSESCFQVIGKGNKTRYCYFGSKTQQSLETYLRYYQPETECPALFTAQHPTSQVVQRLSYRTALDEWHRAIKGYPDLKSYTFHSLRHTFATERVGLMQIEELKALLGHAKLETTLRYQKVTSKRAKEVAKIAIRKLNQNES